MGDPAATLAFDPSDGTVIRTPPGTGYGYWVGGHKVGYDAGGGTFTIFYRERTPLEYGRGGRCAVAVGTDGVEFTEVWSADKTEFASSSIEVGHCVPIPDGSWRLYVSYERAGTGQWRIDVMEAPVPERLDAQSRRTVLQPTDFGLEFIKDPFVYVGDGGYSLYATVPARQGPQVIGDKVHAAPLDATVLATSDDGLIFPTIEYVFEAPGDNTWHGRRARLSSLIPWDAGYLATWDGGRTFYDNYEEWCGLALSPDGKKFDRIDTGGPWVRSPHGAVRYVYGLRVEDRVFFYYEYTREDLSHDLRVSVVDL
jgi:hypothetical protein